jgi:hypothetical protein
MFMRDYALGKLPGGQGNIILDDVQFTPDELTNAVFFAVSAFNAMTPISTYIEENFPNPYLLLIGTSRFLMMSESFHQLRNQIHVQDGDIAPTGVYEKHQLYLQMAQQLKAEFDQLARAMKNQFNMEGAYGSVGSGYRYIGRGRYGL